MEDGLFEIPDLDGIEDEAFPPLPPPYSPGQGGQEDGDPFGNGDEDGDVSGLAEVPAAKRKGVKRPQPKLDSQRLISERGLPALRTLFDNVRFKGKGHEAEDLRLLMQKMENWAHRLFPKLQFEDFIDKVERLGNKKEVQTCLKRIRLDMPLTHEDFMGGEEEAAEAPESHVFGDPDPFNRANFDDLQEPVHSTPAPATPPTPAAPASPSLTEEQRKRMELNRQRALERKLARQQQQQTDPSDSQTVDSSTSADEPTSVSSANVLNKSKDRDEEMEDLDLEPASSSTQQQPSQLPHTDSEPSAESPQCEKEEETSLSQVHQTSKEEETSLSQIHRPSKEDETSLSQVHQTSKEEETSLSQIHQPSKEEETSLSQVHQPSKEEETSLSQVHQPSKECEDGD
ncbi:TIMELESS-interacting protein isoform X3 [Sebastes fasciatus]|uniref:TIMELESS-interacting protein isoform X3 n=1 Tax=Sebastes fasciatus TaxID=394691 RepID=UPI003D9E507B